MPGMFFQDTIICFSIYITEECVCACLGVNRQLLILITSQLNGNVSSCLASFTDTTRHIDMKMTTADSGTLLSV